MLHKNISLTPKTVSFIQANLSRVQMIIDPSVEDLKTEFWKDSDISPEIIEHVTQYFYQNISKPGVFPKLKLSFSDAEWEYLSNMINTAMLEVLGIFPEYAEEGIVDRFFEREAG